MTFVTCLWINLECLGCFASLAEKDRAVEGWSDPSFVDQELEDGEGFVGVVDEPAVVAHEVSDGELPDLVSFDPCEYLFCFGCGFVDAPLVADDGHVVEVVVGEVDGLLHGGGVNVVAGVFPGDVEEAGESEGVGSEFADPFGEMF